MDKNNNDNNPSEIDGYLALDAIITDDISALEDFDLQILEGLNPTNIERLLRGPAEVIKSALRFVRENPAIATELASHERDPEFKGSDLVARLRAEGLEP